MSSKISSADSPAIRLDKWLWSCRLYKTRALAKTMIDGGKVHYNGQRVKASKVVSIGAQIRLWQGNQQITVQVLALLAQRVSAAVAQQAYQETADSQQQRLQRQAQTAGFVAGKAPINKQVRRRLLAIKRQEQH